ncbi:MAG: YfhO family protein, partial [Candidatus Humimicrobiaceae bacterium]
VKIIFLIIYIFKKNKVIYILFVVLIFFDLFTIRDYTEGNISKDYVYKDIKNISSLKLLNSQDENFKIYPYVDFRPEGYWIFPNASTHYHLDIISGYDPLALSDYNYISGLGFFIPKSDAEKLLKNNNVLSILNNKYIFYFKPSDNNQFLNDISINADYKIVYEDKGVIILENPNFAPRFNFVNQVVGVSGIEDARKILWEEPVSGNKVNFDPNLTALVENPDFAKSEFNKMGAKLEIVEYKNNKVVLKTKSAEDSYLVFSDTYYPGWKAYIDKNETKIYKTDGVLKGIYIPVGEHEVIFSFLPNNFWLGVSVTIFSYISLIIAAVILFFKKDKSPPNKKRP